jgi:hypothetical protein
VIDARIGRLSRELYNSTIDVNDVRINSRFNLDDWGLRILTPSGWRTTDASYVLTEWQRALMAFAGPVPPRPDMYGRGGGVRTGAGLDGPPGRTVTSSGQPSVVVTRHPRPAARGERGESGLPLPCGSQHFHHSPATPYTASSVGFCGVQLCWILWN